jgi:hypothetical protein
MHEVVRGHVGLSPYDPAGANIGDRIAAFASSCVKYARYRTYGQCRIFLRGNDWIVVFVTNRYRVPDKLETEAIIEAYWIMGGRRQRGARRICLSSGLATTNPASTALIQGNSREFFVIKFAFTFRVEAVVLSYTTLCLDNFA